MIYSKLYKIRNSPLILGNKYGRLTTISEEGKSSRGRLILCKCDCGKEIILPVSCIGKRNMSCGCYKIEQHRSHKMTNTRLYNIWVLMKGRCLNSNNPSYLTYGGRGIDICREWLSFENFKNWALANGYSDKLSIDRIDVNGNYEPSNCRWATRSQQAINRRPMGAIPYDGITPDKTGFRAQLMIGGKKVYVGHATTVKRAVEIRNAYIMEHNLPHKINIWKEDT